MISEGCFKGLVPVQYMQGDKINNVRLVRFC